jgi:N-acetylneuraminic acid mutarotase
VKVQTLRTVFVLSLLLISLTVAACAVDNGGPSTTATPGPSSSTSTASSLAGDTGASDTAGASVPEPRWGHSMVYDPDTQKVVVFGGTGTGDRYFRDTWLFDPLTATWSAPEVAPRPTARQAASMAYDPATKRVILFGGENGSRVLGDTWAFDPAANTWTQLHSSTSPPARCSQSMVYDATSSTIILFGGTDWDLRAFSDTWAFDSAAGTWTELHPAHSPGARDSFAMAATPSGTIVLFGGETWSEGAEPIPTALADTWTFDSSKQDWAWVSTSTAPKARDSASLLWSPNTARMLLFGGEVYAQGVSFGDMWAFDPAAGTWTAVETAASPPYRDCHAMVDTGTPAGMILFGGVQNIDEVLFNDVWSYDPAMNRWRQLLDGSSLPIL